MKHAYLLILLVALAVSRGAEGGWIRWRGIWNGVKKAAKVITTAAAVAAVVGRKRDLSEFDKNLDGLVDESELEDVFTTREARAVLDMADLDGNAQVTMDEFRQVMTELSDMHNRE
ncbi:uncharacterized protein LOC121376871 [Gigantopelta aegis]|uniref:uncharacterized protein LOC121376871 n=1 Tax=Gigantopelta aegis TaxID=1735272 RepID=UPI001B88E763|nr:uncharacterized protein LOC121376871 [Gigantopelta aegis]XP_041360591.1 uncharacterized protein LOC121376871 [Gigantopelta aegis]XP_041360592.1 uncharacterized protein LOC121376871 [Gigantopelta aegis]